MTVIVLMCNDFPIGVFKYSRAAVRAEHIYRKRKTVEGVAPVTMNFHRHEFTVGVFPK